MSGFAPIIAAGVPGMPSVDTKQALELVHQLTGSDPKIALISGFIVFARLAGMFVVLPFFGAMNIPNNIRVILAAVIAFSIAPLVQDEVLPGAAAVHNSPVGLIVLLVNQVLIGLLIGLAGSFVFFAIDSAGQFIDTQRGANQGAQFNPATQTQSSITGSLLNQLALTMFVVIGGPVMLLHAMLDSFHYIPASTSLSWIMGGHATHGAHPDLANSKAATQLTAMAGNMLGMAVKIAAPAMLAILMSDTLLGIINRGAPQVNVFALSQPIKAILGVAAVFFSLTAITAYLTGHNGAFQTIHDQTYQMMRHMSS